MGEIFIRLHSSEELEYEKFFGFDCYWGERLEELTDGKVSEDCYDTPHDDNFTEIIYMRSENPKEHAQLVFDILTGISAQDSNLLIEVGICDEKLSNPQIVYSNATEKIYYGYGWHFFNEKDTLS